MQEVIPTNMQADSPNEEAGGYPSPEQEGVLVVRGNGELIEEPATVVVKEEEMESVAPEDLISSESDLDEIAEERIAGEFAAQEQDKTSGEEKENDPGEPGKDAEPIT
jgi:hypothetical protein